MKVHLYHYGEQVVAQLRAEGARGLVGDAHLSIAPGEAWGAWSYEQLRALGEGEHDIDPERGPNNTTDGGR